LAVCSVSSVIAPALLFAMAVCLQVNWLALLWRRRQ